MADLALCDRELNTLCDALEKQEGIAARCVDDWKQNELDWPDPSTIGNRPNLIGPNELEHSSVDVHYANSEKYKKFNNELQKRHGTL